MNLSLRFLHNKVLNKLTPMIVIEVKLEKFSFQISKPQYDLLLILGYKWNDFFKEKKKKYLFNAMLFY